MVFKLYFPYFREVDRFKSISPLKHQKQCLHFPAVIEVVIFHVCLGLEGSKHLNLKMVITIGFFFQTSKMLMELIQYLHSNIQSNYLFTRCICDQSSIPCLFVCWFACPISNSIPDDMMLWQTPSRSSLLVATCFEIALPPPLSPSLPCGNEIDRMTYQVTLRWHIDQAVGPHSNGGAGTGAG